MKTHSVGSELFHSDGRQTCRSLSKLCKRA